MTVIETALPSTGEREATIQFSDTFSDTVVQEGRPPIADFDAALTSQVRNEGSWANAQFAIGAWPQVGNYAAVLLSQLRQEQQRIHQIYQTLDKAGLPDALALDRSLGKTLIGIINWAPRRQDHHDTNQNGDDFYLAELQDNIQLFSPLPFLEGVASRGLVTALWRVRDDNPLWPRGEQFRSSIVSQLRNTPDEGLERVDPAIALPTLEKPGLLLAYADKFGNCRLEERGGLQLFLPAAGEQACLRVGEQELRVTSAARLTDIPEDSLGIYINPADNAQPGSRYLELVRRVSDPNDSRHSAYAALCQSVVSASTRPSPDWSDVSIELVA